MKWGIILYFFSMVVLTAVLAIYTTENHHSSSVGYSGVHLESSTASIKNNHS